MHKEAPSATTVAARLRRARVQSKTLRRPQSTRTSNRWHPDQQTRTSSRQSCTMEFLSRWRAYCIEFRGRALFAAQGMVSDAPSSAVPAESSATLAKMRRTLPCACIHFALAFCSHRWRPVLLRAVLIVFFLTGLANAAGAERSNAIVIGMVEVRLGFAIAQSDKRCSSNRKTVRWHGFEVDARARPQQSESNKQCGNLRTTADHATAASVLVFRAWVQVDVVHYMIRSCRHYLPSS